MAGFGSIGTDEASGAVVVQHGNVGAFGADCTVEEDDGNLTGSVYNGLSNVGVTGGNNIDDQQVSAASDSGANLLQLLGCVFACILVVVLDADFFQLLVQLGTNGTEVNVSLVVPENGNLDFVLLVTAAGGHTQNHGQCENDCENLFHSYSS